jgi:DNA topoisomerase IB
LAVPPPTGAAAALLPLNVQPTTSSAQSIPSTSHAWSVQHEAWNNGLNSNWLPAHTAADGANAPYVMGYHNRADIPFHYALADAFTICDHYHCSMFGPTWPNRMYWMTGTCDPNGTGGGPILDNNAPAGGYTWTTYAERLTAAGVSWKVYQQSDVDGKNMLQEFRQFQNAPTSSPLYQNGMRFQPVGAFEYDARNDKLPTVTWILPSDVDSEHPNDTPAAGAAYIASKIDAIAANPDVWAKTVFILSYDENDGLFDHVVPPTPAAGTPDECVTLTSPGGTPGGGLPVGGGFRVPCCCRSMRSANCPRRPCRARRRPCRARSPAAARGPERSPATSAKTPPGGFRRHSRPLGRIRPAGRGTRPANGGPVTARSKNRGHLTMTKAAIHAVNGSLTRSELSAAGIRRRRCGRGFRYYGPDGTPLTDEVALARIKALVIPPAWEDVWICAQADGHIQAVGTDVAGRRQYRYHDQWREQRDREKFDRMLEFGRALPHVRTVTERHLLGRELSRDRVLAAAVRLIDLGFFRSGGDEYATENDSFGLATIRREHVTCHRGGELTFDYTGKSGKRHVQSLVDEPAYAVVRSLKLRRTGAGRDDLLVFRSGNRWHNVTAGNINDYLRDISGGDFTAKDFRTWHATVLAAVGLAVSQPAAESRTARKRAIARVVKEVADYLGNTPAVARASYIDPRVIADYEEGSTIASSLADLGQGQEFGDVATKGHAERAVLKLLASAPARHGRRRAPR